MNRALLVSASCLALLCPAVEIRAESSVSVTVQEQWSNLFAGRESVLHATVKSRDDFDGRVGWRLASSGRTIDRSERAITLKAGTSQTI